MLHLYTNSNQRKDHLRFELERYGKDCEILIAVPFFTYPDLLNKFSRNSCNIKLIVRLCESTSPAALSAIINDRNIVTRFYTSPYFHPKFYIFGNRIAFVGSSNLTDRGLISNQEVNIAIQPDDPRFDELKTLFDEYWEYAEPLEMDILNKYQSLTSKAQPPKESKSLDDSIREVIGNYDFPNIQRDIHQRSRADTRASEFRRDYQLFLRKFSLLEEIYKGFGQRKVDDPEFPLRFEIDQFLNWIRETYASGDSYLNANVLTEVELRISIPERITEFMQAETPYINNLHNDVIPRFRRNFGSPESIIALSADDLYDTLLGVNAFVVRIRYCGDRRNGIRAFFEQNDISRVKETIIYLLFWDAPYIDRLVACIFDQRYTLQNFRESCVKELFGWCNTENIPPCNERILISMTWMGFGRLA